MSGEEVRSRQHSLVQQADEQLRDMEAVSLRFATLDADLDSLADRASVAFLQLRALVSPASCESFHCFFLFSLHYAPTSSSGQGRLAPICVLSG